jgi:hypothetical protein
LISFKGGLRNWETGDDPWIEHARWFRQELESEDISSHEQTENVNIKQLPTAIEIRQMGYTWDTIKRAYQNLNKNRAGILKIG